MPYRLAWEPRGVHFEFFGRVTAKEIEFANEDFYGDSRSDTTRYQIIDALRVESVEWQMPDIQSVAAHDLGASQSISTMRVAYIARQPEVTEKLERYIEISRRLNTRWTFKGFTDFASARAWAINE